MPDTWDIRKEYFQSMSNLLVDARRYADSLPLKLLKMQEIYLRKNKALYTEDEIEQIKHYFQAALQKFYQANLSLEQLWAVTDNKRLTVLDAIAQGVTQLESSEDEFIMISLAMETFLFQSRAFLDIYMIYICLILKTDFRGKMSHNRFFKELSGITQEPFLKKSKYANNYFANEVFSKYDAQSSSNKGWGQLIRDLRDKVAHQDVIKPFYQSKEILFGNIKFNWPTIQGMTYDRFCQDMQNGMFYMLTDLATVLYDLEWKAGIYTPDMWSEISEI